MVKTLLVDGDNLFKIGFHGVRDYYHEGNHIGGIYHFVNALKKFLEEHNYDKVIVFWDGNNNASQRRALYPQYKENRRETMNEIKKQSFYLKKLPPALYCGAFIGMSSSAVTPSIYFVIAAGMVAGLFYMFSKNLFLGVGGKLGTIAFVGVVTVSLIYWFSL